ncbi:DUF2752 domain-containing protein [Streptomyces sp. CT34]|uniref:DUF2752 domain-containing protein n=1 Tax=Streptomyces sp. CT34 TaxID=1553907 RepID=UPI0005B7DE36|nr:DUF2752 domain-containing protein [Streptomyces sp. CT34]
MSRPEPRGPVAPLPPGGPVPPDAPDGREAAAVRRHTVRRASLALGIGAPVAGYLWNTNPHHPGQLLLPCPFRWATGLQCPFCGGTRMAYDLMHGDVAGAFHDNAVLLALGVPTVAYVLVRWLAAGLRGQRRPLRLTASGNAVALGIAAVWMVARNLIG